MASHVDFHDENHGMESQAQAVLKSSFLLGPSPHRSPLEQVSSNLLKSLANSDRSCNDKSDEIGYAVRIGIADLLGVIGEKGLLTDNLEAEARAKNGTTSADTPGAGLSLEPLVSHPLSEATDDENQEDEKSENGESSPGRKGLGKARRVRTTVEEALEGQASDLPKRALQAGARRVQCGTETGSEAVGVKEPMQTSAELEGAAKVKEEQPMAWFPRAKKDSFLERKIKKMQESEGPIEHLGEAFVKKMSLVEREKAAAATAAKAALAAKRAALVEVSWCRILEAAGIACNDAIVRARTAESDASEKAATAAALGVVLSPAVPSRSSPVALRGNHPRGYRDVIFASTQSEADVEKEVVRAVRVALGKSKVASADGERNRLAAENGLTIELESAAVAEGKAIGEVQPIGDAGTKSLQIVDRTVSPGQVADDSCPGHVSGVSVPEKKLQTSGATSSKETQLARNGEPRSPGKASTPHRGSLFGGLLSACISPPNRKRTGGDRYDSSSDEEGEPEDARAHKPLSPEMQGLLEPRKAVGEEAPVESARLEETEGINRAEEVTGKEGGQGLAKVLPGAAFVSPGKAAERYSDALERSDSDDEGAHATCALSPSRTPVCATPFNTSPTKLGAEQPGITSPGLQTVSTPGGAITDRLTTGEESKDRDELIEAMSGRLAGLSDEQRAAVGGVVATRGFAGFMANSPLGSRLLSTAPLQKPNGLGDDFLIRRSKMEIAKADALEAAKAKPAVHPTKDGLHVGGARQAEPGLDQVLVKRLSKLEIAKAEAIAASKAEVEKGGPVNGVKRKEVVLAEPGLDQVLVKRMSKLEQAKADALAAAKAEPGEEVKKRVKQTGNSADSDFGRDMVKHMSKLERAKAEAVSASTLETELRSGGKKLGTESGTKMEPGLEQMVKHVSKLEKAKAEAVAASKGEAEARSAGKKIGTESGTRIEPGLDQMVKRLSKLEQAKAAAKAASVTDFVPKKAEPRKNGFDVDSHSGGLDNMVKKTSRLEREKEEARAQKTQAAGDLTPTTVLTGGFSDQDFVKKVSRLEREKLAAREGGFGASASAKGTRAAQDAAAWEGQGLGGLKKHVSRLERDKLAWKEAEEAAKGRL